MKANRTQNPLDLGFTLVELIVVIAILGILSGIGVAGYSGYIQKANEAADKMLLGAVNSAFQVAVVQADPEISAKDIGSGGATLNTNSDRQITGVTVSGTHGDKSAAINTAFGTYFGENQNTALKYYTSTFFQDGVFVGVHMDIGTPVYDAATQTTTYTFDGVEYKITDTQRDAVLNSTYGTNMTMGEVTSDVSGMVGSLSSALGGGSMLSSVLTNAGLDLAGMGINSSDENYLDELANATVLMVAQNTTADTATNLVNALSNGNINSLMNADGGFDALLGNMAGLYGIATGFANSDAAATWSTTVDGKDYNATQYYDYVNSQIAAAASANVSQSEKINNIINAMGLMTAYVYDSPDSSALTSEFTDYATPSSGGSSQLQNDVNGYVNAMAAIAANSDSLVSTGAISQGFASGEIAGILNTIFGS